MKMWRGWFRRQSKMICGIKIHHEKKTSTPAASPVAKEEPTPVKKQEDNPEDGVVLRWR